VSEWYPQRGERELAALSALESSIKRLASEFQGQSAFNFYHESELTAYLMVWLRRSRSISEYVDKTRMYLAHLEWPCLVKRRIDLVLWQPGTCKRALYGWPDRGKLAKELPLLAAVQVKRGPGKLYSWPITLKDIKDLETLYTFETLRQPVLYFLEWVDHDLRKHESRKHEEKSQRYREVQSRLKEWCDKGPNRRTLVISRDRVGFAYPKGAWLVDPLPPDVRQNIY
jgi:hypothetical protein